LSLLLILVARSTEQCEKRFAENVSKQTSFVTWYMSTFAANGKKRIL